MSPNYNISFEATPERNENIQKLNILEENLKQNFVIQLIKNNINNFTQILMTRLKLTKFQFFQEIKSFSQHRKINHLKAEQIYTRIINSIKIIFKFYKRKEKLNIIKSFIKWKDISYFFTRINKYKNEYEQNFKKKLEREIKIYENRIKEKEKEISELKNCMNKNLLLENELILKIKKFEEKENHFLNTIKGIEEENKILKDEFTNLERKNNLENKIKEYENLISKLQDENKEKDISINLFVKEMSEMLQAHEKNIDLYNIEMNEGEMKHNHNSKSGMFSPKTNNINISKISSVYNSSNNGNNNINNNVSNNVSNKKPENLGIIGNFKPLFVVTNNQNNQNNNTSKNSTNNSLTKSIFIKNKK